MSAPDYGLNIAEAFQKYLKTGDMSLIEEYSAKELQVAISRLSPYYDNNKLWYRAVEQRIDELAAKEGRKQDEISEGFLRFKDRWLSKLIAFGLGFGTAAFLL